MNNKIEEQLLCVIKDFNEPSVNGIKYNLDADCSKYAIQKFISKKEVYGEFNHPLKGEQETNDQFQTRINTVNETNVAIHISELTYCNERKQIIGLVKNVGKNINGFFEKLQNKDIAFGMRSLCHSSKSTKNDSIIYDIVEIITFDIINGH